MKAWLLMLACWAGPALAAEPPACQADPLQGRPLYLRGSFNGWAASEAQQLTWACTRWQGVARITGAHRFKIGDEAWSADADFGSRDGTQLLPRGPDFTRRFNGMQRYTVTPGAEGTGGATLAVEDCPTAAPWGDTTLYLRGGLTNWVAQDEYAFQYSCDAYYLNVKATGPQEFKVADAAWKAATTFPTGANSPPYRFDLAGEHTLRLAFAAGQPQLTLGPKTFGDPSARAIKDPVALSLRFDSRAAAHKRPFGAQPAPAAFDFTVTALPGVTRLTLVVEKRRLQGNQEVLDYTEVARVPMVQTQQGDSAHWSARHTYPDVAVYGYWFEAEIAGQRYALQNNADAVFWTREKGSGGLGSVVELPARPGAIRRFRQTVYAPDFQVPDWAADLVYYSIFPERFRNGDPGNDPKPGVDRYHDQAVEGHARWTERPYRPGSGDGSDASHNNDFFGGDLAGIIQKLDYIQALGANAIYMTPIFKAASNHKYDTADYLQIDPGFGSDADFLRLTREAARRGIRIMLDTSLNHTGADSLYFDRYRNQGGAQSAGAFAGGRVNPQSPYAGWYRFDTTKTDPDAQYTGWGGPDLPELDKSNPALRRYFFGAPQGVMQHWLDRGAAGWRMDVAPWVPDDFWRAWRKAVKASQPDALTVSEVWFDASKFLLGDMFDSTMNYIFRNTVLDYAAGGHAAELYRNLELTREAYPPQAFHALMNLLSSHDVPRALHHFGWSAERGNLADAPAQALAKRRLKLAVLFQMTFPGAPAIYYGDEVGVTGGDDPYNRATYPWADQGGEPDTELLAAFKTYTALRHRHAVLRRGSLEAPLYADAHVLVLARRLGGTWALTATNNGEQPLTVSVALPEGLPAAALRDALSDLAAAAPADASDLRATWRIEGGRIRFEVPALGGRVFVTPESPR